jgi:hypothetical protein
MLSWQEVASKFHRICKNHFRRDARKNSPEGFLDDSRCSRDAANLITSFTDERAKIDPLSRNLGSRFQRS